MARKRDPRRQHAKEIWLESDGKKLLKEIAQELGVSDSQIRKWKSIDKWSAELKSNVTESKSNVTKAGAPLGNQNAKGNKGNSRASPPLRNKNALKTGEYETIFAGTLSDEEQEIYSGLSDDPLLILDEEIRLLKIRQLRMMNRIKEAEDGLTGEEIDRLQELRNFTVPVERDGTTVEVKQKRLTEVQVTRKQFRKIDTILSIEESLTRVSNQLVRAIKQQDDLLLGKKKKLVLTAQEKKLNAETEELRGSNKGNEDANNWSDLVVEAEKELGELNGDG